MYLRISRAYQELSVNASPVPSPEENSVSIISPNILNEFFKIYFFKRIILSFFLPKKSID